MQKQCQKCLAHGTWEGEHDCPGFMLAIRQQEFEFLRESNAIEGVYDERSFEDALQAWNFLMKQEVLDLRVICKTHAILMQHQNSLKDSEKGEFRQIPVFIGDRQGLNWRIVPTTMDRWARTSMRKIPPIDSIQLHVEYEKIHPFVDGNGRTGRMFLNWTRKKITKEPLIVFRADERDNYYKLFH